MSLGMPAREVRAVDVCTKYSRIKLKIINILIEMLKMI
jgi:hypothetical protein